MHAGALTHTHTHTTHRRFFGHKMPEIMRNNQKKNAKIMKNIKKVRQKCEKFEQSFKENQLKKKKLQATFAGVNMKTHTQTHTHTHTHTHTRIERDSTRVHNYDT